MANMKFKGEKTEKRKEKKRAIGDKSSPYPPHVPPMQKRASSSFHRHSRSWRVSTG